MKVKKIKVGIKGLKSVLEEYVKTGDAIERGGKISEERRRITSFEAFRKALTPKRLELLHIIKAQKPSSINELARFAKRDVKNIAEDVNYLEQIGPSGKKKRPGKQHRS